MSLLTPTSPMTAPTPSAPLPSVRRRPRTLRQRLFAPGWPLAWLFLGYPLWWILGVSEGMTFALAGVMALELVRRRPVIAPRGFGLLLLFLLWCLGGVFLLQVDAVGAEPGASDGRYLVWAFRLMWYLSATIILLYVGNLRRELPLARVARILSWMFVAIVVGGVAGTLIPDVDFPSVIELLLPGNIVDIPFVQQMVHPNLAQVQRVLGYQEARPSAPFSYTNTWGLAFACFLPFFVVSWFGRDAGWRRVVGPVVLAVAMVPVIGSLNRGLWGALAGMVVFLAVRYAVMGRTRLLLALLVGLVALGGVVAATPLSETVALRFANQHSNEGRTDLGTLTVTSTLAKSPVVGYGTTRDVQGNFSSIAGGATSECPKCSPPSLGTQGQAWLLTFTTGIGGLLLYGGFFVVQFVRFVRLRSAYATAGLCTLVAHAITCVVYNVNGPGLLAIMIGSAFLWRESMTVDHEKMLSGAAASEPRMPTLAGYAHLVRRHLVLIVLLGVGGGYLGVAAVNARGVDTKSSVSVTVAEQPPLSRNGQTVSIDTEASFVDTRPVLDAVSRASGLPVEPTDVSVTATPNSRVLHIAYFAGSREAAQAGALGGAKGFLADRTARLSADRAQVVAQLDQQIEVARRTLARSQTILAQLRLAPAAQGSDSIRILASDIDRQIADLGRLLVRHERARNQAVVAGSVIAGPSAQADWGLVRIFTVSGVLLGILLAIVIGMLRERQSPRLRRDRTVHRYTGLPVLAEIVHDGTHPIPRIRPVAQSFVSQGVRACLAAGRSERSRAVARVLDASVAFEMEARERRAGVMHPSAPGVVLVIDSRCRAREVNSLRTVTERSGSVVIGVARVRTKARKSPWKSRNAHGKSQAALTLSER